MNLLSVDVASLSIFGKPVGEMAQCVHTLQSYCLILIQTFIRKVSISKERNKKRKEKKRKEKKRKEKKGEKIEEGIPIIPSVCAAKRLDH